METTDYTMTMLTASPGHKITTAEAPADVAAALITDRVYLAAGDSADNYREITDAEADVLAAERDAADAARRAATLAAMQPDSPAAEEGAV